jgi:hypothetical protein
MNTMRCTQGSWNKNKIEKKEFGIRRMKSSIIPHNNNYFSPVKNIPKNY